jgi:flagellar biosynthesis regulator FlaF
MTIPNRDSHSSECVIDIHTSCAVGDLDLDRYLVKTTQQLEEMIELANRGETVSHDSRDWMLTQVDFIIEAVGNEALELNQELRSDLLQLLLAIANLNEQIRHQASLAL